MSVGNCQNVSMFVSLTSVQDNYWCSHYWTGAAQTPWLHDSLRNYWHNHQKEADVARKYRDGAAKGLTTTIQSHKGNLWVRIPGFPRKKWVTVRTGREWNGAALKWFTFRGVWREVVDVGTGYGGCLKECEGVESEGFRGRLDTNGVKDPLLFLPYYSLSSPLSCSPLPLSLAGSRYFPLFPWQVYTCRCDPFCDEGGCSELSEGTEKIQYVSAMLIHGCDSENYTVMILIQKITL